jgi:hypothetical protein
MLSDFAESHDIKTSTSGQGMVRHLQESCLFFSIILRLVFRLIRIRTRLDGYIWMKENQSAFRKRGIFALHFNAYRLVVGISRCLFFVWCICIVRVEQFFILFAVLND